MTDGSIDDTHRDLDPSLEPHFASLLSRHKEAVALTGPFQGMVYTAMQEAATRTFYLCVARACGDEDPLLGAALRRIAKDETLHMAFYRDVVRAHLDKDPDYLRPLAAVMVRFEMPWSSSVLHDFEERRAYLAT